MKLLTSLTALSAIILNNQAFAHTGHVAENAGHSHWIGYAIIALVIGAVCIAVMRTRKPVKA